VVLHLSGHVSDVNEVPNVFIALLTFTDHKLGYSRPRIVGIGISDMGFVLMVVFGDGHYIHEG
jgi:hypothetical protein